MAREGKTVKLRMVEDSTPARDDEVVRLGVTSPDNPVVRVIPEPVDSRPAIDARLVEPERVFHDGRSQEPDVDTLLAPAASDSTSSLWDAPKRHREPVPWGWFALVGLVLGTALTWSLLRLKEGGQRVADTRKDAVVMLENDIREDTEARVLLDEMERIARRFCEAESVTDLLDLIRHRQRLSPLVAAHYADQPVREGDVVRLKQILPLPNLGDGEFWVASLELDSGPRNLLLESLPDGSVLVDWESAVCHQPVPWDDYVTNRPQGVTYEFRVYAEPDNLFSHEFADESRWSGFRLSAKDSEKSLVGYTPRGGPVASAIIEQLQLAGGRKVPCILRLSIPKGLTSHSGVIIERLVSPRWIHLQSPDGAP